MKTDNTPVVEMYTHSYGEVKVGVQIDYVNAEISLVELNNVANKHNYPKGKVPEPKKWVFNERGLDYMNGWKNILAAMESAIEDAEKKLKAWVKLEDERKLELMEMVHNATENKD